LCKCNLLELSHSLFNEVVVTRSVLSELYSVKDTSLQSVEAATKQGWVLAVEVTSVDLKLGDILDQGEASAITYSLEHDCMPILIDEKKGRTYAKFRGISVIGTAGVLIRAKQQNHITLVRPLLNEMKNKGYWLSDNFIEIVAAIVGE